MENEMKPEIRFKEFTNAWERDSSADMLASSQRQDSSTWAGDKPSPALAGIPNPCESVHASQPHSSVVDKPDFEKNSTPYLKEGLSFLKLVDIADRFDNLRIPVAENLREKGLIPYYGANGIQDYINGYTHDGEYVLVAEDGANDLDNYPIHYVNGKVWINNHAHVLQVKNNNSNLFLSYLLKTIDFKSIIVGGSRAKLNADTLMNIELSVPNHAEQKKIGKLFAALDSLVALHQRKCEKLKNIKKALLEKMFC